MLRLLWPTYPEFKVTSRPKAYSQSSCGGKYSQFENSMGYLVRISRASKCSVGGGSRQFSKIMKGSVVALQMR